MKLICKHCGETFQGNDDKFCSSECKIDFMELLNKRIYDAIKNDHSHTKKLCSSQDNEKCLQRENS